ncbi:lecithin retinol acyltransferase family protein [Paraburkholderia phenazinium]|uniref:Lecithin retinol acyltransferase n=1 Tax=Paraburkholderia phenazinium TaxID=60549 RepID=A0A1G7RYH5_9BURK|nr:lecithin retinol acyltransferase family protein [Paraburkholderia phenazinium]SDG15806.1 Lecithin retinol acyltransferase [Paraburkholderia phenazinium]
MNSNQPDVLTERQRATRGTAGASSDIPFTDEQDVPLGAHLVTSRGGYEHHGIYAGAGKVVHYAGFAAGHCRGPVVEVALACFAAGSAIAIRLHPCAQYTGAEAVRRARSRLGENRYSLLTNNCEHFCAWCLSGESRSQQVETCLAHPRAGLHVLASLFKALVAAELKGMHRGARIA